MSILSLFRGFEFKNSNFNNTAGRTELTTQAHENKYRSFNLGKFEDTELSIFLEICSDQTSDQLNLRLKNEGSKEVSDIQLIVKTSSQIVIENRGEVFGTSKKREIIKSLPKNRSLSYSTQIRIYEDLEPAYISVALVKKGKGSKGSQLSAQLSISPKISQLGA